VDFALGVLAFWPALALGSFANVVAARVPLKRSVVKPRSACQSCGVELAWYDNVPVLSYLLLRGRCRSCHVAIGWIYPAVELAIAGLVAACFVHFGLSGEAFVASFFCAVLVVLSAIDLRHRDDGAPLLAARKVVDDAADLEQHRGRHRGRRERDRQDRRDQSPDEHAPSGPRWAVG
jgi:hypothetical protein